MKSLPEVASAQNSVGRIVEPSRAITQMVDPLAVADWDSQIGGLPGASFFYTSAWARTIEGTYGYKPLYLVKTEGGNLRGLLPIMEVDSWLTGKRGISLPFSDECAAIGTGLPEFAKEITQM